MIRLEPFESLLVIFLIAIVYVVISTIRMILTMKGYKYKSAFLSMIEIAINVTALGLVLNNVSDIKNLLTYVFGFGVGIVIGMKIEEKMMLGYVTTSIVTESKNEELSKGLREHGYGVTGWVSNGIEGQRQSLQVFSSKKQEKNLLALIKELDNKAFIVTQNTKMVHGGFGHTLNKRKI